MCEVLSGKEPMNVRDILDQKEPYFMKSQMR